MADAPPPGLVAALREFVATVLSLARTRLQLLGVEIETEATRFALGLVWGFAVLFFAGLAIVFGVLLLLIVFWDQRVVVVTLLTVVFAAAALIAGLRVRRLLSTRIKLFEGSMRELAADVERLRKRS